MHVLFVTKCLIWLSWGWGGQKGIRIGTDLQVFVLLSMRFVQWTDWVVVYTIHMRKGGWQQECGQTLRIPFRCWQKQKSYKVPTRSRRHYVVQDVHFASWLTFTDIDPPSTIKLDLNSQWNKKKQDPDALKMNVDRKHCFIKNIKRDLQELIFAQSSLDLWHWMNVMFHNHRTASCPEFGLQSGQQPRTKHLEAYISMKNFHLQRANTEMLSLTRIGIPGIS